MKTSIEVVSEIEVRIDVEVPADEVSRELERQLASFSKRARIKGFRPGKAPKAAVQKTYGSEIASEAMRQLVNRTFPEAVDNVGEHRIVGEPSVEPGLVQPGQPLKYAVRAEVKPRLQIHSWEGLEVALPEPKPEAEAVEARIQALREQQKERVPVEDRKSDTGDIIVIHTQGWVEGARDTRLDMQDFEVKIGSGQTIPGFEDELIGLEVGSEKGFDITFPDNYHEGLAGKPARFEATVQGLFFEELPDLDDAFAADLGFADLEALRADNAAKVHTEAEKTRRNDLTRKVVDVLLERNQFQVPRSLEQAYVNQRARTLLQLLQGQGVPEQQAMRILEGNWAGIQAQGKRDVRRTLALEALALQQELDVTDEELSEAVIQKIQEHGERAGEVYARPEMRESLRLEILEERALDLLLKHTVVVVEQPQPTASPNG